MAVLSPDPQLFRDVGVATDERAARRTLRDQIARLEAEIGAAVASAYPRLGAAEPVAGFAGPRLLDLGELERTRDELAERLRELRARTSEQADRQEAKRLRYMPLRSYRTGRYDYWFSHSRRYSERTRIFGIAIQITRRLVPRS